MTHADPTKESAPPRRGLNFLVVQHGYRGTVKDFEYLLSLLNRPASPSSRVPSYIVLDPRVNEGAKSDGGVVLCAERLADYVLSSIAAEASRHGSAFAGREPADQPATSGATSSTHRGPQSGAGEGAAISLSFVTHSMGALIVRAALPAIAEGLHGRYAAVHWGTFCSIAGPHVGVAHMPSKMRSSAGNIAGRTLRSKSLLDMYLHTEVLTSLLLEDRYLTAWRRFQRRVLVGAVNDNTVMAHSALLAVPPYDVTLLRGRVRGSASHSIHNGERAAPVARPSAGDLAALEAEGRALPTPATHRLALRAQLALEQPAAETAPAPAADAPPADAHQTAAAAATVYSPATRSDDSPFHRGGALSADLWPLDVLPPERAIAERIVAGAGPFELYVVDFRPLIQHNVDDSSTGGVSFVAAALSIFSGSAGRGSGRYGAQTAPHRAIICKAPCNQPRIFGFVSEFIVEDVLGLSPPTAMEKAAAAYAAAAETANAAKKEVTVAE